jgi:hypothetical protein
MMQFVSTTVSTTTEDKSGEGQSTAPPWAVPISRIFIFLLEALLPFPAPGVR